MELLFPALLAGALTILAPCILPLLPVIVGGTATTGNKSRYTPLIITGSLMVSVVVFTLLLRTGSDFLGLSDLSEITWQRISGGIIILLGVVLVFPRLWDELSARSGFQAASNRWLGKSSQKGGHSGSVLMGAALGPVFTSCSPTYAFILFSILPRSYGEGVVLLIAYALGLAVMLLAVAYIGKKFVDKVEWASNPHGLFRKIVGALFVLVGIAIITGFDKDLEAWLLDLGVYDPITDIETTFIEE
ncbi:MAG: cytochrome c biogenesis protein CcdA [Candidatus Saccharimonadales bacterium]|nr:cytochrome c biogenesis protein CcdA [Candidatus Saccharimonadales bacterium]